MDLIYERYFYLFPYFVNTSILFYEFQSLGGITGRQYVFKLYFEKVISIYLKRKPYLYIVKVLYESSEHIDSMIL